jgi:hypothetical protein
MLLTTLRDWAPFRIDALGLVTILGAAEVDVAVGRLVHNCLTEWLPILGAYTVASNQVATPLPGFVLYNVTDGIMATDLSSWLTRWLISYPLTYTSTVLRVRSVPIKLSQQRQIAAPLLATFTILPVVILTAAMGDWWGLANAVSMILSVLVRRSIVSQNRHAVDAAVIEAQKITDENVTTFVTTPNGQAVTMYAPRMIVVNCFLTNPRPSNPTFYDTMRALGWVAFGVHIVALGMARLFSQILSVLLLAISSVISIRQIGDHHNLVGSRLCFEIYSGDPKETRSAAYARMRLSESEENSMIQWNLFPHRSNVRWWAKYRNILQTLAVQGPHITTQQKSSSQQSSSQQPSPQQSSPQQSPPST